MVADGRVDERGLSVCGCAMSVVDVSEHVVTRLDAILHGVQQLGASGQDAITLVPRIVVTVACNQKYISWENVRPTEWRSVGDENVELVRNVFPFLQDCGAASSVERVA